jgi:hypothetical protein
MSRLGGGHARQEQAHRIAGVQERAGSWHVVVVQNRTGLAFLEARSFAPGDAQGVRELLRRHRVDEVVRLAPADETICKCVAVPTGSPDSVADALVLLGEAQLPDGLPRHRRASGVIPDRDRGGFQTGMLLGWKATAGPLPPPLDEGADERWTGVPAALAMLSGTTSLAVHADAGTVTVVARGPARTLARVLIADAARDGSAAVRETAEAVGLNPEETPWDEGLRLDNQAMQSLANTVNRLPQESPWIQKFGLALGAAMVAASENPATRPLAGLSAVQPQDRVSLVEHALTWLSSPARAYAAIATAVALALLGPLGVSWGRAMILAGKTAGLDDQSEQRAELARQAALYEALEQARWPMTKLLADLASATPVGVVLDGVRLSPESGIALDGTAQTSEQLNQLQANFNKTGMFRDIRIDRAESTSDGVKFSVSGKVVNPHAKTARIEDFAAKPLAERLYGPGASNSAYSGSTHADAGGRAGRPRGGDRTAERPAGGNGSGDAGARPPDRPSGSTSASVPAALSDAAIAAMDPKDAGKAWAERKSYLRTARDPDQATKDRINAEIDKLFARFRAGSGGGG